MHHPIATARARRLLVTATLFGMAVAVLLTFAPLGPADSAPLPSEAPAHLR